MMQDHAPPDQRTLLRRTAGPYIGSWAVIVLPSHARNTPEADSVSAAFFEARLIISMQIVSAACAAKRPVGHDGESSATDKLQSVAVPNLVFTTARRPTSIRYRPTYQAPDITATRRPSVNWPPRSADPRLLATNITHRNLANFARKITSA